MGGCLGCCSKSTPVIEEHEYSKGLKIQGRAAKQPIALEDFWNTTTNDMESGAQSQRSMSSVSTSVQTIDPGSGSSNNPPEFVNHGVLLWNQTRQQWIGNAKPINQSEQVKELRISWNATYDSLLGTNTGKPFPQPIPLSEMVDFLVDAWEQEGLYD